MGGCCGGSCGTGGGGTGGPGGSAFHRVLRQSFVINALTAAVLLWAGMRLESAALMAGALGFVAGALNYGASLAMVRLGPGHGVGGVAVNTLVKNAVLALASVGVMAVAVTNAAAGVIPDAAPVSLLALAGLGIAVTLAVLLFAGRRGGVSARAVWLCARRDALAMAAVIAAAAGVWLGDVVWPDTAVALGLAGMTAAGLLGPRRLNHPA